jgi:hypothetical protein
VRSGSGAEKADKVEDERCDRREGQVWRRGGKVEEERCRVAVVNTAWKAVKEHDGATQEEERNKGQQDVPWSRT